MGLFSNKISRDKLKAGDHIYSWRSLSTPITVRHILQPCQCLILVILFLGLSKVRVELGFSFLCKSTGIYVGYGEVIHFTRRGGQEIGTGTFLDKIMEISVPRQGRYNPCVKCGDQGKLSGVISSCLDCFLAGGNLYLYEYSVSRAIFHAKQRGTCTTAPSDPSDEVVSRANFLLSKNGFGDYHLLDNNCEDFALYCKTSRVVLSVTKLGSSSQANSLSAAGFVASMTLKFVGEGKSGHVASADSMVSAAKNALSSKLGIAGAGVGGMALAGVGGMALAGVGGMALAGVGGMALAGVGDYCNRRLNSDIGVRNDAVKVPVERLAAVIAVVEGKLDNNKNLREEMEGKMDRSQSSGTDSCSWSQGDLKESSGPMCHCKSPTILLKSWTDDNPGRRFFRCDVHGFFKWAEDEKPHGWQKESLLEARDLICNQKEDIKSLKDTIKQLCTSDSTLVKLEEEKLKLEEEKLKLEVENMKLVSESMACQAKEKLMRLFVVVLWGSFVIVTAMILTMVKN